MSPWNAQGFVTASTTTSTPSAYTAGIMLDNPNFFTSFYTHGLTLNQFAAAATSTGTTIITNLTGTPMLGLHVLYLAETSTDQPIAVNGNSFTSMIFNGEY
jgi:hypothetical protein